MQSKVSMVVPCYNKVEYIGDMLDSVIAQVWDNIELILVNDGSTDGTREVIVKYEPKLKNRGFDVIIIDRENAGCCAAVYAGLLRMTGDYFCLVDCDDEIMPEYVSRMAGWLDEHEDYDLAACNFLMVSGTKEQQSINPEIDRERYPDDPGLLENFLLYKVFTAAWMYMSRIERAKRMIYSFCTERRKTYEPCVVIPMALGCRKVKFFSEPLYKFKLYANGYVNFENYESVHAYYSDYIYLNSFVINRLGVNEKEKKRLINMGMLGCLRRKYYWALDLPNSEENASKALREIYSFARKVLDIPKNIPIYRPVANQRWSFTSLENAILYKKNATVHQPNIGYRSHRENTKTDNSRKDVSIIIPVYNTEQYLEECLDSVIAQSYESCEIILINDGSTDRSGMIIEDCCKRDDRFVCINQENKGVSAARNAAIDIAKGEYLLFLDSDDVLDKDTLSELMPIALSHNLDMLHTNWNMIPYDISFTKVTDGFEKDVITNKGAFIELYAGKAGEFSYLRSLFKTQIIKDNSIRFETDFAEDIVFNMQSVLCCKRFLFTSKEYYFYRQSNTNLSAAYYNQRNLVYGLNNTIIEMFKTLEAIPHDSITQIQRTDIQRSILVRAVLRYDMFQDKLLSNAETYHKLPGSSKIVFWGAGRRTAKYIRLIGNSKSFNITVVDNDLQKQGKEYCGYRVLSPEDLLNTDYNEYQHIIAPRYSLFEFFSQMKKLGIISSIRDLRLNIGENEQYDLQLQAMDDLYKEITRMGVEPGEKL